jgi:hypothetical protein
MVRAGRNHRARGLMPVSCEGRRHRASPDPSTRDFRPERWNALSTPRITNSQPIESMSETKKRTRKWWLKERHNIQTGVYYVPMGQISAAEAKANTRTLYGHNIMHSFDTLEEYRAKITELEQAGESLQ